MRNPKANGNAANQGSTSLYCQYYQSVRVVQCSRATGVGVGGWGLLVLPGRHAPIGSLRQSAFLRISLFFSSFLLYFFSSHSGGVLCEVLSERCSPGTLANDGRLFSVRLVQHDHHPAPPPIYPPVASAFLDWGGRGRGVTHSTSEAIMAPPPSHIHSTSPPPSPLLTFVSRLLTYQIFKQTER